MVDRLIHTSALVGGIKEITFSQLMEEWQDEQEGKTDVPGRIIETFSEEFRPGFKIGDGQFDKIAEVWIDSFHKWGVRKLDGNNDQGEKRFSAGITHAITDKGLALMARKVGPDIFAAGMISTEQLHCQRYGRWAARLLLDNVPRGYHLSVWLLPADGSYPPEIDMLEVVNNGRDQDFYHFNDHGFKGPAITREDRAIGYEDLTLECDLVPGRVRWMLNGDVVRDRNIDIKGPMYFLMTWEVGSNWSGPVLDDDAVAKVTVRYVRAYRHAPDGIVVTGKL